MGYMLAHQGGWDEALVVAIPLVALGGLIFMANRRADALASLDDDKPTDQDEASQDDPDEPEE